VFSISSELLEAIFISAVAITGYHGSFDSRPVIKIVSPEYLTCKMGSSGFLGVFDHKQKEYIFLAKDAFNTERFSKVEISSILLHEMVHWLQFANGAKAATNCAEWTALESEAYGAQYKFLQKSRTRMRFTMPICVSATQVNVEERQCKED